MTPAETAILTNELNNDPRGYGYLAIKGNDTATAQMLMRIRDGSAGSVPITPQAAGGAASGIITIKRPDVMVDEFLEAIDVRDFITTANNLQQEYFQILLSRPRVPLLNPDNTDTRRWTNLKLAVVPIGQNSQARLLALATRPGSRLEELLGVGRTVVEADVALAYGRG